MATKAGELHEATASSSSTAATSPTSTINGQGAAVTTTLNGNGYHDASKTNGHHDSEKHANNHDPKMLTQHSFDTTDPAFVHTWFWEDRPTTTTNNNKSSNNDVLTQAALQRIAAHEYVSGGYTVLDRALNPFWARLTECLPLWVAPNLVTVCGALHCLVSYTITTLWYYYYYYNYYNSSSSTDDNSNNIGAAPAWLLIFNGYCLAAAYTLDAMDGKQARRIHMSSPLGQLLDHGLDSLCLLAHVSANQAWLFSGGSTSSTSTTTTHSSFSVLALPLQAVLQFAFFMAQWEEFYTRRLPHATGPYLGVTEVNYGMALVSLGHGIVPVLLQQYRPGGGGGLYDAYLVDDVELVIAQGVVVATASPCAAAAAGK